MMSVKGVIKMSAVDQYMKDFDDPNDQQLIIKMDKIISEALPKASSRISYGLIGYFQPKQICFFGISKDHIGFYPTNKPIEHFQSEIKPYLHGKPTLWFKQDPNESPIGLVQEIAKWNLEN